MTQFGCSQDTHHSKSSCYMAHCLSRKPSCCSSVSPSGSFVRSSSGVVSAEVCCQHTDAEAEVSNMLETHLTKWLPEILSRCMIENQDTYLLPHIRELVAEELGKRSFPGNKSTEAAATEEHLPAKQATSSGRSLQGNATQLSEGHVLAENARLCGTTLSGSGSQLAVGRASQLTVSGSSASASMLTGTPINYKPSPLSAGTMKSFIPRIISDEVRTHWFPDLCIVHPDRPGRRLWDSLAFLVLICDTLYMPLDWSFLQNVSDEDKNSVLMLVMNAFDVFWFMDMFLNFITAYYDSSTCKVQTSHRAIAMRYLKTWFVLDFMATAPPLITFMFHTFASQEEQQGTTSYFSMLRVLKVIKLVRVARMTEVLRKRLEQIEMSLQSMSVISALSVFQLLAVLIVTSHMAACSLWFVATSNLANGSVQSLWVTQELMQESISQQYSTSLHATLGIITGFGNGAYVVNEVNEQSVLMGCYLIALVFIGLIVDKVTGIYAKMNEHQAEVKKTTFEISKFLNWYNVPLELQERTMRYVQHIFDHKKLEDVRENLKVWLKSSGELLPDMNISLFGSFILRHPLLCNLPRDTLTIICELCEVSFFPPTDQIISAGKCPDRMIYLRYGTVELIPSIPVPGAELERQGHSIKSFVRPKLRALRSTLSAVSASQTGLTEVEQISAGDILFSRELLLPCQDRNTNAGVCKSFCETVSLEFVKFNSAMEKHDPVALHVMRVSAAINEDSADMLSWSLANTGLLDVNVRIAGETLLHKCARQGANACIEVLIKKMGANLNVRDDAGSTAMEVAALARNKSTVDLLVTHGAQLPLTPGKKERALSHGSVGAKPKYLEMLLAAVPDQTQEELESRLEKAGIDLSKWGVDGAKRLSDLFEEVRSGKCACVLDNDGDGKMTRIACVVRVKVHAKCTGRSKVLHETETQTWFNHAGQVLRLPAQLMKYGQIDNALEDLWFEKFGLCMSDVNENFTRSVVDLYVEEKVSASYPGFHGVYIVHEVPYWACEPIAECKALGLPEGATVERSAPRWPDGHMVSRCYVWTTENNDESALQENTTDQFGDDDDLENGYRTVRLRQAHTAPSMPEHVTISIQRDVRFSQSNSN
eukprot:gnl/MRDRNA2_/MRDRNA2_107070_c0_seq1.p1 gnl/MRDRNA2_/MRDRNA2_107070_c0~~gnl/MRDRNA2_/MRDRNA2_107070_c0_seq1.p1  ORF type:complete len:1106 (-),score=181.38 gnl/MRDRNA2_/MRDRNA2_107070_c0_seq1:63-3380(-)